MGRSDMEETVAGPTEHELQETDEVRVGRSVAVWIGIATPVAVVGVTLALWLVLDVTLGKAFAIGAWPAVLVGVFGGGFLGIVRGAD
jgi:hypothetical protein